MKRVFISFAIASGMALAGYASESSGLSVSVAVDGRTVGDAAVSKMIQSRLERSLSGAGIITGDDAALFLTVSLVPVSQNTIEGGMRNIRQVSYDLTMELLHPILGTKFGTYTVTLAGDGYDDKKAMTNAVRKLNESGSALTGFLTGAVDAALRYYDDNLETIISKARTLSVNQEYEAAIALLWNVPESAALSQRVHGELEDIFMKMQSEKCGALLQKARNAYALKQYAEAMEWLNAIDAGSPCGADARQLGDEIGASVRAEEQEQMRRDDERERMQYEMAERESVRRHEMEKQRADAIAGVARAYLEQERRTVYYVW